MPAADNARNATQTARKSLEKGTDKAAKTAKRATQKVTESAGKAAESVSDSAASAKASTSRAVDKVKGSTRKAVAGARATRAAKAGLVEDARDIVEEAGADGAAAEVIAEVEGMHYQVEVNKRALSVTALTKTLNERWENGWRLAHILEQRGNTVLVFEKRA